MVFLACRNFDPSPSRLDLVASRCRWSSNRCGMSSVNRFSFRNYGTGVDTGACKLAWIRPGIAGAGCRVSSFQTPQSRLSVVAQDSASTLDVSPKPRSPVSVSNLLQVVSDDLRTLNQNLKSITGADNPVLVSAAEQIFNAGGKRLRPALVFLVSRATTEIAGIKELTLQHQRLAEIIEMIHTASLIHDDVIDDSNIRRGMHQYLSIEAPFYIFHMCSALSKYTLFSGLPFALEEIIRAPILD
uniref:Uncharacterized protein n=1 Tax=Nelumbo nucifera TaxID=4432 RepID=A0A822Z201_NELNU|nr:TPA_asm: hypothetical protein HUJ06_008106 [Nelumbo nucifera]